MVGSGVEDGEGLSFHLLFYLKAEKVCFIINSITLISKASPRNWHILLSPLNEHKVTF